MLSFNFLVLFEILGLQSGKPGQMPNFCKNEGVPRQCQNDKGGRVQATTVLLKTERVTARSSTQLTLTFDLLTLKCLSDF